MGRWGTMVQGAKLPHDSRWKGIQVTWATPFQRKVLQVDQQRSRVKIGSQPTKEVGKQQGLPTNCKPMNGNYIPFPFRFLHWKRLLHPDSNEEKYKRCHRSDPFQGQGDLALRYLGFGAKASHEELQSCETLLKMSLTEAGGLVMASWK